MMGDDIVTYTPRSPMTLLQWESYLLPLEAEALSCYAYGDPEAPLTPNEVLDAIVEWKGGLAGGHEVRSTVARVYGIELR